MKDAIRNFINLSKKRDKKVYQFSVKAVVEKLSILK